MMGAFLDSTIPCPAYTGKHSSRYWRNYSYWHESSARVTEDLLGKQALHLLVGEDALMTGVNAFVTIPGPVHCLAVYQSNAAKRYTTSHV